MSDPKRDPKSDAKADARTGEVRSESWIEAGLVEIARTGVEGVRVEVLAKNLGVTKGGFYRRFRDRAGADRDMRFCHADHIDHQRHREDRAAAADQAEREPDQHPRRQSQHALRGRHDQVGRLICTARP